MKTAYFTALRELTIEDVPAPKLERPEDVLLRIDRVGVCGSDVHYFLRGRIGDQIVHYPATLGHECSGTVMEVGPAVANLKPGDRVAVDPAFSCGQCDQCQAGRENTCRNLRFMGCPGEAPGAAAEFYVLPGKNCRPIPEGLTLDQAVLAEPLSIALHAVRLADVQPDARVAVLGAGPIGLSVLLCCKATAPCSVFVTDLIDERLTIAWQCGADGTGNTKTGDVVAEILHESPQGLDLVFECSGDPEIIDHAQQMLAPGGTLMLVGIPSSPRIEFDPHVPRRKELTFKNVRRQQDCVVPAMRLMAEGLINADPLLTHHFPLAEIRDAFELVAAYEDGVVKAVIHLTDAE